MSIQIDRLKNRIIVNCLDGNYTEAIRNLKIYAKFYGAVLTGQRKYNSVNTISDSLRSWILNEQGNKSTSDLYHSLIHNKN